MEDPEGFRNPKEREIAAQVVEDIKNKLSRIDKMGKNGTEGTDRDARSMIKSISTTVEDKRIKGLREIFGFYAQQHLPQGLQFGDIENKKNILDLGEFLIFSKDFQIPLNKKKVIEIFKKTSSLRQLPVNFEEFLQVIDKIGIEINIDKIQAIKKRLKEIRKIEKEMPIPVEAPVQTEPGKTTGEQTETEEKKDGEGDTTTKQNEETSKDKDDEDEDGDADPTTNKDDESDSKSKTVMESKKSIGQTSKSGVDSDDESGSESKSKTSRKSSRTRKTKTEKTSNADSESEDDTGERSGMNKSVRFSTIGDKRERDELQHSEIDDRRSLDLIPEEPLDVDKKAMKGHPRNTPLQVEKERLEIDLEKLQTKTVED